MKTKITFLAIAAFILSIQTFNPIVAQQNNAGSSYVFSIIRVVNTSASTIAVFWNNDNFEEIEILSSTGETVMPTIPVFDAKQITLNDLEDGIYYINFKQHGTILQTKIIQIQNYTVLQDNI